MKSLLCCIEECGTKKLLNISGRGSENGDKTVLYPESGEANEKWYYHQSGAIKSYSAKNKALTYIPETNKLVIWDYNVKDLRQHFMFKPVGEGKELVVSKYNGKVMSSIPPRNTHLAFVTYVKDKSGQQFRRTKTSPTILTDTMGGVINWAVRFGSGHRNRHFTEESFGRWYRLRNAHTNQYISVVGEDEDRVGMITEESAEFDKSLSWWFFHDQHICNARFRRHCIGYDADDEYEQDNILSLCEFNGNDASQKWKLFRKKVLVNEKDKKALHVNRKDIGTFNQQKGSNRFFKLQIWDILGEKHFPSRYFQPFHKSNPPSTPTTTTTTTPKNKRMKKKQKGIDDDDDGFVMVGEWGGVKFLDDDDDDIENEEVMINLDFEELIKKLKEAKYSTEKERLLREVAGKEFIRCDQLDIIMNNLLFVEDKLWTAKLFRGRIVDRKNAMILTKHFDFEDEKMEILNTIARKRRRKK